MTICYADDFDGRISWNLRNIRQTADEKEDTEGQTTCLSVVYNQVLTISAVITHVASVLASKSLTFVMNLS